MSPIKGITLFLSPDQTEVNMYIKQFNKKNQPPPNLKTNTIMSNATSFLHMEYINQLDNITCLFTVNLVHFIALKIFNKFSKKEWISSISFYMGIIILILIFKNLYKLTSLPQYQSIKIKLFSIVSIFTFIINYYKILIFQTNVTIHQMNRHINAIIMIDLINVSPIYQNLFISTIIAYFCAAQIASIIIFTEAYTDISKSNDDSIELFQLKKTILPQFKIKILVNFLILISFMNLNPILTEVFLLKTRVVLILLHQILQMVHIPKEIQIIQLRSQSLLQQFKKEPTQVAYQYINQQIKMNINNVDKIAFNVTSKFLLPLILLILFFQANQIRQPQIPSDQGLIFNRQMNFSTLNHTNYNNIQYLSDWYSFPVDLKHSLKYPQTCKSKSYEIEENLLKKLFRKISFYGIFPKNFILTIIEQFTFTHFFTQFISIIINLRNDYYQKY